MDPIKWLSENKQYFSPELNEYHNIPVNSYLSTLPLVDRDGKILDLGAGNGMLLNFLMAFSGHQLTPFGIDLNEKAIQQAKEIMPAYAQNFFVGDVTTVDLQGEYDIIISNPFYATDVRAYTERCLDHLTANGRLIYRVHEDVLKEQGIRSLNEVKELRDFNMRFSNGYGIVFGIINMW